MRLIRRRYQNEEDYWKIRTFLREVFLLNNRREICWPLYRWDYWRLYMNENLFHFNLQAAVFMWETEDGHLAAVLHPNANTEAVLQIHPAYHSPDLELEMLITAETQYAVTQVQNGRQRMATWTLSSDENRKNLLHRRGYYPSGQLDTLYQRDLSFPLLAFSLPSDYAIRIACDDNIISSRKSLNGVTSLAVEKNEVSRNLANHQSLRRCPLYRRDLDLVAVMPDESPAAHSTLWLDDVSRTVSIAPIGTLPDPASAQACKAILTDGLLTARRLGANLATAHGVSRIHQMLFTDLGFTAVGTEELWINEF